MLFFKPFNPLFDGSFEINLILLNSFFQKGLFMSQIDIRWKQRFDNFNNAFHQLHLAVELSKTRQLTDLERQGLIQSFEFTHELAWKVLKDYLEYLSVIEGRKIHNT